MKRLTILCAAGLLAACTTPPTATETAQVLSGLKTLAQAAPAGSTAAQLVADGTELCAASVSPDGVLVKDGLIAVASLLGTPVSVVGATSAAVAAACPPGLVPGALPPGVSPDTVPVVVVQTELKAAT